MKRIIDGKTIQYDKRDEWLFNKWTWRVKKGYLIRKTTYIINGKRVDKHFIFHRIVLNLTDNKTFTDHINHNSLDNRRSNLRIATNSQNQANQLLRVDNVSGYKGVSWHKSSQVGWQAKIKVMGKCKYLGIFNNPRDAAKAYNKAALKYFGTYAELNLFTLP